MDYTILMFDRRGRLTETRTIRCAGDDDALERTALVRHDFVMELRDGDRLVWRFEARQQD